MARGRKQFTCTVGLLYLDEQHMNVAQELHHELYQYGVLVCMLSLVRRGFYYFIISLKISQAGLGIVVRPLVICDNWICLSGNCSR